MLKKTKSRLENDIILSNSLKVRLSSSDWSFLHEVAQKEGFYHWSDWVNTKLRTMLNEIRKKEELV